jgi:16S rRNA (cytosine967-C5)-methyltransferase
VTPARQCAYDVIRRVFERGAYADRALHAAAVGLEPRERAQATRLAYGAVQRRGTVDHLVGELTDRPLSRLDPPVLAALRLGAYELLFADAAAPPAAVNEAVALARAGSSHGAGLVNAVLRRLAREGAAMLAELGDSTPEDAARAHSLPLWLARMWWGELGAEQARALMARVNEPAESALRANGLRVDARALAELLPVACRLDPGLPEAVVVQEAFDAHGSPLWREGAFMPQSRGAMLAARALAPRPGERVLDLCAAPGAKTTHLAALMEDRGSITAVERHPGRARALRRTCERMGATIVEVRVGDGGAWTAGGFDRALVDPPCSGLGTLQSRPDLRWRASPERIEALAAEQARILAAAAEAVRPGGELVYCTCTLAAAENERQIERFLAADRRFSVAAPGSDLPEWHHPGVAGALLALPHRHGTDGFFVVRLERMRSTPPALGGGSRGRPGSAGGDRPGGAGRGRPGSAGRDRPRGG